VSQKKKDRNVPGEREVRNKGGRTNRGEESVKDIHPGRKAEDGAEFHEPGGGERKAHKVENTKRRRGGGGVGESRGRKVQARRLRTSSW